MKKKLTKKQALPTKVEGNIIELLPVHCNRTKPAQNLTESVKANTGNITIQHHSRYFTAFDMDTLVSIFKLYEQYGCKRDFPAVPTDIARVMNLNRHGKCLTMVKSSMREIGKSPIEIKGSWYDIKSKTYIDLEQVFTLFEYKILSIEERQKLKIAPNKVREHGWISLSKYVHESIQNGYFKFIDPDIYFSLPTGLTRLAYLYLEKRLGKKDFYEENINSALKNILKKDVSAKDKEHFKDRIIPKLQNIFIFDQDKLSSGIFNIKHKARQLSFIPRFRRPKLSDHGKYILERACEFCGRNDDYFKNVLKKYIVLLGSDLVDCFISECRNYAPDTKSKYLIHLLKSYTKEDLNKNNLPNEKQPTKEQELNLGEMVSAQEKQIKSEAEQKKKAEEKKIQEQYLVEKAEDEKLDHLFKSLPMVEQNSLKAEARQRLIREHQEKYGSIIPNFLLLDTIIMIKVREILLEKESVKCN